MNDTAAVDVEALVEICIGFAAEMLAKRGEFYPFGAQVKPGEGAAMVAGHIDDQPEPQALYALLLDAFKAAASDGEVSGVALAANVDIPAEYAPEYPDGVRIHVEASGYSRFIYFPYQLGRLRGLQGIFSKKRQPVFAEPFAVEISPQIFVDLSTSDPR